MLSLIILSTGCFSLLIFFALVSEICNANSYEDNDEPDEHTEQPV